MNIIRGTPFTTVYKNFLSKTTEDMYMQLSEEDTYEILRQLLLSAIPSFEFPRQSLKYQLIKMQDQQDQDQVFTFIWAFVNELTQEEINILGTYMVVQWVGQQLASVENVRMKYSGPDFKFTSQANHMHKLLQLEKEYQRKGFHLQRLYKRRKVDKNGIYRSTFAEIMEQPVYKDTNSITGEGHIDTKNFILIKGDSLTFDIVFSDLQNVDITNIIFSVKNDKKDSKYVFQKTLNDEITVIDNLRYRIQIAPQDTQLLMTGEYYYDLGIILSSDIYTIMMGTLILKQE